MKKGLRFSIRFKILIALLLIVTGVVSIITFTMANLFHADKSAYIRDLTSEMAMHTASETSALLNGYRERLQVFTRLLLEKQMPADRKTALLKQLFEDFGEFVAVSVYAKGSALATVYDARSLDAAGVKKKAFLDALKRQKLPMRRIRKGQVFIANATIAKNLPVFTLALALALPGSSGEKVVTSAVIRLAGLQHLAERSKVFTTFIVKLNGKALAHSNLEEVVKRKSVTWVKKVKGAGKMNIHGSTHEYIYNGEPMVGGLASIEGTDLLAGVQIPKAAAYLTARELLNNLTLVALVMLIAAAIIGLFGSRLLTRTLERLSDAARIVAKGRFDVQVAVTSRDEIGELAVSFNQMAAELDSREKALKDAQAALIQSEKMAAFGQLGAGIAHEIKNPLAGILGLAQLSMRKMDKNDSVYTNLGIIEKETNRCTNIIQNLLKFSRQEKVTFESVDVNQVAKDAMAIVEHQLEMNKVKLISDLDDALPNISGNANQIQQVLINLMINAQQAMEGRPGEVTVATSANNGHVEVQVIDTGPGIPEELQAKIFEPFFTTKPVGKGTGLGLSVSYGIIQEHKGDIQLTSSPDEGTCFSLTFPGGAMKSSCPHCGKSFKIQPGHVGLKNKCKSCGGVFQIQKQ
jgi:signal transduction histidine kinase